MNEIVITQHEGNIEFNFDAIKEYLDGQLEAYRKLVFTEDSKKDAKNTVAELRKQKADFAECVKAAKKQYLLPLDAFLAKAAEISDMFDVPIAFINEQVAVFEAKRIEEKKAHIVELYEEIIPEEDIREYLPLKKIYNSKWENATTTDKAIKEEMMNTKLNVKSSLQTLNAMDSEALQKALDTFKLTLDINQALAVITSYENQKKEILAREEERRKREDEERIRREEREKAAAEEAAEKEKAAAVEEAKAEVIDSLIPEAGGAEKKYIYNITLTKDAKEKLERFMDSVGIEYEQF